ncbi:type IV pilus modification protein PilV [Pleionea sediminis]|uniref:type IV pilus modification protein PilV n=1 Tax=Pleionea sediminis TaxID=2569479 RepID=UPI001186A94E|nr:type IV pilus modification protein PilV [Pleionea sediminis]
MLFKVKGLTLIEVLVAVLILGIGLLGVAALQVTSIGSNHSGYLRTQASSIAHELASRIRGAKFVVYNTDATSSDVVAAYTGAPYACENAVTNCNTGSCSIQELRDYDHWEICSRASDLLPDGEVYVDNPASDRIRIAVAWTPVETREDTGQGSTDTFINVTCEDVGVPANQDCVLLEVIP